VSTLDVGKSVVIAQKSFKIVRYFIYKRYFYFDEFRARTSGVLDESRTVTL